MTTSWWDLPHVSRSRLRLASRMPRRRPELVLPDGRDAGAMRLSELHGVARGLGIAPDDAATKDDILAALKERLAS